MEKLFEVVLKISTPLMLAGVVVMALFLLSLVVLNKLNFPKNRSYHLAKWIMTGFFLLGVLALTFGLVGYRMTNKNSLYRVRVVVLDPGGRPVGDAHITSAPDGNQKQSGAEYEIQISDSNIPKDRKLRVWATREDGIFAGTNEILLNDDYTPVLTIQLRHETSAHIKGQVIDENGDPISGVTVYLQDHPDEKTTTDGRGHFDLPAYAASTEYVHLFVEDARYQSWNDVIPAGGKSLTIVTLIKKKRSG